MALKGNNGVVFAVENIVLSKLYEPGCVKRIFNVDSHIGMVGVYAYPRHSRLLLVYNPTPRLLLK